MGVLLKIDHREGKLKDLLVRYQDSKKLSDVELVFENLAHADIQVWIGTTLVCILERKSYSDLLASIKDGRYRNQKAVLFDSGYVASQIYYIIEGTVKKWNDSSHGMDSVKGAMINTLLRDKISLFWSQSVEDTADLIREMVTRIQKDPSKYTEDKATEKQIVTLSQNDKVTPAVAFVHMLCQIPGISNKSGQALATEFGTMKQMMQALGSLSPEEQKKRLDTVKVGGRKMSSKIVENIISHLLC